MWGEMNIGLTDHGANVSSNLSTDTWMADDENLVSLPKGSVALCHLFIQLQFFSFLLIYKTKCIPLCFNMIFCNYFAIVSHVLQINKTLADLKSTCPTSNFFT